MEFSPNYVNNHPDPFENNIKSTILSALNMKGGEGRSFDCDDCACANFEFSYPIFEQSFIEKIWNFVKGFVTI